MSRFLFDWFHNIRDFLSSLLYTITENKCIVLTPIVVINELASKWGREKINRRQKEHFKVKLYFRSNFKLHFNIQHISSDQLRYLFLIGLLTFFNTGESNTFMFLVTTDLDVVIKVKVGCVNSVAFLCINRHENSKSGMFSFSKY